ncbi:hypothetical protein [Natrinema salsiterrestre]|uniref:Uncharacterized protein n=1 Tax=Natrinema salsiterrestre TaxID=2950540 RepID=A0A9Q4L4S7_9EURY|nr:hypothetical protein [Natrinema salsiterrestre]MDF9747637.1 hypothetical protein [Natrinema salsiterrestre]
MSLENEPTPETPTCSRCGIEMERRGAGTEKPIPLIGSELEFQQFGCPECGQGARFERSVDEEEWSRAGV